MRMGRCNSAKKQFLNQCLFYCTDHVIDYVDYNAKADLAQEEIQLFTDFERKSFVTMIFN